MGLSTTDIIKKLKNNSGDFITLEGDILRKYQSELLKILADIIDICEEENIVYQLSGGTALGAVRHSGFIPWDDDADINILSKDFDKFIECFSKKYGEKYWIHTCHTPNYGLTISRIRLKGSVFKIHQDINNIEAGFFVEIFRMENTFNNYLLRTIHGFFCMGFGFLLSCRKIYEDRDVMLSIIDNNNLKDRFVFRLKIAIGFLISFISLKKWAELTQWIYSLSKNNKSKYLTIPAGRNHYFKEMYLREGMEKTIKMDFEGYKWRVAKNYDEYLSKLYGNYMKIPSESKRETHVLLELKFPEY